MKDALLELPEFPPGAKGVLWENWPLDKVGILSFPLHYPHKGSSDMYVYVCSCMSSLGAFVWNHVHVRSCSTTPGIKYRIALQ